LLAGLAFVLGLGWRDRRIRSAAEAEEIYGHRLLAEVPAYRGRSSRSRARQRTAKRECFAVIRARLRYGGDAQRAARILVTSGEPQAGRSFVALNLARAAAAGGERALLIEADLRRPSLGRAMDVEHSVGLAELLSERSSFRLDLGELLVSRDASAVGSSGDGRLDVLFAGTPPANPIELLGSVQMAELLDATGVNYDLVIVDAPAMGVVSDALAVAKHVDAAIVVSRLGHSRRDDAIRLARQLRELNVYVTGLVVNEGRRQANYPAGAEPTSSTIRPRGDEPAVPKQVTVARAAKVESTRRG
jgi:receptor protein-tyrosine kinase